MAGCKLGHRDIRIEAESIRLGSKRKRYRVR